MPEKEIKPLEEVRADALSAIKVNGVVVSIPERREAVYIAQVPGLFGEKFPELIIKPLITLPTEKTFELEKIEREGIIPREVLERLMKEEKSKEKLSEVMPKY